ncbi:hypothetical protein BDN72DRAFT_877835 [Pluteus cervinus]|uniref:Uncharacterized protein n=1 Tax=Pluteus cervinus TaxID=181527 RepID=A0ACD3AYE6_9AGAR|nr:hypothetical protein BDN72DRAFT_877835 [Pluteus cervinus]
MAREKRRRFQQIAIAPRAREGRNRNWEDSEVHTCKVVVVEQFANRLDSSGREPGQMLRDYGTVFLSVRRFRTLCPRMGNLLELLKIRLDAQMRVVVGGISFPEAVKSKLWRGNGKNLNSGYHHRESETKKRLPSTEGCDWGDLSTCVALNTGSINAEDAQSGSKNLGLRKICMAVLAEQNTRVVNVISECKDWS